MEKSVITFLNDEEKQLAREITRLYFGHPNIARGYAHLIKLKAKELNIEL